MSDIADITDDRLEVEMAMLIEAARHPAAEVSDVPSGECRNGCGEPALPDGHHCSVDCMLDHERRKQLLKRQGAV